MNARVILALTIAVGSLGFARADEKPGPAMDPQAKGFADWQQQLMKRFDADGDGKLSDGEKLAMQQAMTQQGWNLGIQPGGFPGEQQFLKQFDRNGDGKLDQMESMMAQQAF